MILIVDIVAVVNENEDLAMKGWFDAFRYDGGPTLYSFNNRTAVTGDVTVITFLAIFSTLYVAFLIIFPGIRKEIL
ncbi:hypothetical protein NQ315_000722 [Exocentrus adspersus]|uniref:NADH dehydrogenase subunit 6 n=1 Tax=Exocentrus adspersus TaxID=1586481 RepID=A0AAV8WE05_9CUCU|nr:hypothetical protein NQ315_000722 [Exocentrus adspersus]